MTGHESSTIWLDLLGSDIRQSFHDVRGVRTRALEGGDGPTLIFLHGGGGHAEAYVRNLPAHAERFHCYAIDMLGHGLTDAPSHLDYTTDQFIDHVVAFMDSAGIERASFSGESFGGRVAAWIAMQHPDRVERLVLNTTGGLPVTKPRQESDVDRMLASSVSALQNPTYEAVRSRLGLLFADPTDVPDEFVRLRQRMYRDPSVSTALQKLFRLVFDPTDAARWALTPDRLQALVAPTLVIWSDHNPIHTFDDAKDHLGVLTDVRFHLVQNAGHWPQYEQAEEFNRVQLNFLLDSEDQQRHRGGKR